MRIGEGGIDSCLAKSTDPGKTAPRRLGIVAQRLTTSPWFVPALPPHRRLSPWSQANQCRRAAEPRFRPRGVWGGDPGVQGSQRALPRSSLL